MPLDGTGKTVRKGDARREPEQIARTCSRGLGTAQVTASRGEITRRADDTGNTLKGTVERIDGGWDAGGDIDDAAGRRRCLTGPKDSVDQIGNVDEIPGGRTVATDIHRIAAQQRRSEERNDATDRRYGDLAGTIGVEETQDDGVELEEHAEKSRVLLPDKLVEAVGGDRDRDEVFVEREDGRMAIHGRRAREHDSPNTGVASGQQDVVSGIDVGPVGSQRIGERAGD